MGTCLDPSRNKNVLADVNVSKLTSLAQGYVSVQENATIININLILLECVSNYVLPASFQSFLDSW